jgi:cellulose biosynthesis protein BcsQ
LKIISLFNNKGGVGKTTYLYHIAHLLSDKYKVLMIDCDSQCNLSSYCLQDNEIEKTWKEQGNSIYRIVEELIEGIGEFRKRKPLEIKKNLYLVPGDIEFSLFEDKLANTWIGARGGETSALRLQAAVYRYIDYLTNDPKMNMKFDIVLMDLGPNLGSLNRSLLISSDYFIVPVAPDLFSIRGTENLGKRIFDWSKEWEQTQEHTEKLKFKIPLGKPKFLGYVAQNHNSRQSSNQEMTKGWAQFGVILESSIKTNIVEKLQSIGQVFNPIDGSYRISQTPNLHSLIPYSMVARKPIYMCTYHDGLKGAHISKASESKEHFEPIFKYVDEI